MRRNGLAERGGGPAGQVLQRNGHPLDLNGRLRHHVLKLPVFELGDGPGLARILDRYEVFPLHQLLQVNCQLFRGILRKKGLLPQQPQDSVPVHLVVHLLVLQVEDPHNSTIDRVVVR